VPEAFVIPYEAERISESAKRISTAIGAKPEQLFPQEIQASSLVTLMILMVKKTEL